MDKRVVGIFFVLISAFLFSTSGILVREIAKQVTPFSQAMLRALCAVLMLLFLFLIFKKNLIKIKNRDMLFYLISGVIGYGLMIAFFTLAILKITIANTFLLLFLEPVFAIILAGIFLKERANKRILLSLLFCVIGIAFIFNPLNLTKNLLGNSLALLSGFCYAVYVIVNKHMGKKYSAHTNTLWAFIFAQLILIPLAFLIEEPLSLEISKITWLLILIFSVISILAYFVLNLSLKKLKAGTISILLISEPIFAIILGLLFYNEKLFLNTAIGGFLIVLSVIIVSCQK